LSIKHDVIRSPMGHSVWNCYITANNKQMCVLQCSTLLITML